MIYMAHILLIEDDNAIRSGLVYFLGQEGFTVFESAEACTALQILEQEKIDIILLDINLPDESGFDLFPKIKKISDVPVIFLTAIDLETSIVMGLDMGADDYITKPFKARELVSRIKNVLRRKEKSYESKWNLFDLTIDTMQARVLKKGRDVFLTSLEYKIFLILAMNPNRVFTREQILADVWDVNEDYVNDNALTVYMKRIREKIEDDPTDPKIIMTVRGIGYKLNTEGDHDAR